VRRAENSNNEAASQCIEALAFQYTNGALIKEGFDPAQGLLYWIGSLYPLRNTQLGFPPVGSLQGATPHALLLCAAALEARVAVSSVASQEIIDYLANSGTFMTEAFKKQVPPVSTLVEYGKDGSGTVAGVVSELDVARKTSGARYASAIIAAKPDVFDQLAVAVDAMF
jgi:hypothetical protein